MTPHSSPRPGAIGDEVDQVIMRTWSTHTVSEQAALLGRAYTFVQNRRGRLIKAGMASLSGVLGDEIDQILIETWATHSGIEQASLLNRTYPFVKWRRCRLVKAGLVSPETRKANRHWTEAERHEAEAMISEGMPLPAIAAKLGRHAPKKNRKGRRKGSQTAVWCHLNRRGTRATEILNANPLRPLSASEVARLMGHSYFYRATLHALIDAGVLTVKRHPRKKWQPLLIDMTTFADFLANRRYWMAWDAERITDPDWRDEALRLRAEADGCWVAMADWCKEHHYSSITSWFWVHNGLLPSAVQWRRRWYVWSTELATFVPPSEQPKTRAGGRGHG